MYMYTGKGRRPVGVAADHSKGQDTRQSTIAIQTEVDEDAITVRLCKSQDTMM